MSRTLQMNIRLSKLELVRLDSLAAHYGISRPELLRLILKREERRLVATGELDTEKGTG